MTYGCTVWARQANKATAIFKLIKVQRLALLLLAPMRRSTPTAGLEMILGVPPMELYIKFIATATYNRLSLKPQLWSGNHGGQKGHITWLKERTFHLPHTALIDRCVCHEWNHRFTINIAEGEDVPHTLGFILCYTTDQADWKNLDQDAPFIQAHPQSLSMKTSNLLEQLQRSRLSFMQSKLCASLPYSRHPRLSRSLVKAKLP
jgi:hypothetical protein